MTTTISPSDCVKNNTPSHPRSLLFLVNFIDPGKPRPSPHACFLPTRDAEHFGRLHTSARKDFPPLLLTRGTLVDNSKEKTAQSCPRSCAESSGKADASEGAEAHRGSLPSDPAPVCCRAELDAGSFQITSEDARNQPPFDRLHVFRIALSHVARPLPGSTHQRFYFLSRIAAASSMSSFFFFFSTLISRDLRGF